MSNLKVGSVGKANGDPVDLTKQEGVKAWVNFDTHGSDGIRDSLNTSSMTDLGTGIHRQTFVNSMASTAYSFVIGGGNGRTSGSNTFQGGPTSTADGAPAAASLGFTTNIHSGSVADPKDGTTLICGELA